MKQMRTLLAASGPIPAAIGPYRVRERLGVGGMGVVYLAEQPESGERVALKTVLVPDDRMLSSIRREIRGLARLAHPGIVRIVAEGLHEGLPWYAMELLDGSSLTAYCDTAVTAPRALAEGGEEPLPSHPSDLYRRTVGDPVPGPTPQDPRSPASLASAEVLRARASAPLADAVAAGLTVIHRLCEPLSYMHGKGIIHRDLKPDNILVRDNGLPVILDFGLATPADTEVSREVLSVDQGVAGTVHYMAPEQIRGELVDARADLYSLGCILYELVAGRLPFLGETPVEVMRKHLTGIPTPPSLFAKDLPGALEKLIMRLLEKDPRDRLGYATDVSRGLAPFVWNDAAAFGVSQPRTYLYRPGFAGREQALHRLEVDLESMDGEAGAMVFIGGESGIGKTRFAMELARRAIKNEIEVMTSECLPPTSLGGEQATALQAFRRTLQRIGDLCRRRNRAIDAGDLAKSMRILSAYEPSLETLSGPYQAPQPPLPELPPEEARLRAFAALTEAFEVLTEEQPMLLILDDIQWADELTVGFLEYLAQGDDLTQMQLVVAATYRTEEVSESLRNLLKAQNVIVYALGKLDCSAVESMIGNMLSMYPAPRVFSSFLFRYSEGNPFFVCEYLLAAVQHGILWRDSVGYWQVVGVEGDDSSADTATYESLSIPRSIRELVHRRLQGLSGNGRLLVEAAAVIGREVPPPVAEALSGLVDVDFLDACEELLARCVLEETRAGGLRFTHDKIREVAYEQIAGERRRVLHARVAGELRRVYGPQAGEVEAQIAHHYEAADARALAVAAYRRAACHARSGAALDEALRCLGKALALSSSADRHEEVDILRERAAVCDLVGRWVEAQADLARAETMASVIGNNEALCAILLAESDIKLRSGKAAEARDLATRAATLAHGLSDEEKRASALNALGAAEWRSGYHNDALLALREALVAVDALGEPATRSQTFHYLGLVNQERGELDEAMSCYQEAMRSRKQLGDQRGSAAVLMDMANLAWRRGEASQAKRHFEQALTIYEEIGDYPHQATALGNLGVVVMVRGELGEAVQMFKKAYDMCRAIGDRRGALRNLNNMALVERDQGSFGSALERFRRVVAAHREADDPHGLQLSLYNAAAVLVDCGGFDEALELLREAEEICRRLEDRFHLAECLQKRGEAAWYRKQCDVAASTWQEAEETAVAIGYVTLELPIRLWRAIASCGQEEAPPGADPLALLERSREIGDADLISEVGLLAAELLLRRAGDDDSARAALAAAGAATNHMRRQGASRDLAYAFWLQYVARERLRDAAGATASLHAAIGNVAGLRNKIPPELLPGFLHHPRIAAILAAGAQAGILL
ncbi:MAG: tetratricopeptide repeat protein [Candidatus Schekmanbacteria bacterium]|nr:tetratricopeptide repeat protein [Candidatus Schekmanbacteria bacterium]